MTLSERWRRTWSVLDVVDAEEQLLHRLLACYSEPHRRYHTVQHLAECLQNVEVVRSVTKHPAEVEVALWFHDAIYDTRRNDNEARSADWAREQALSSGLSAAVAGRIHELVMATRHDAVPATADAEALVDVDLAILGAEPERFDEYERQVREEYAWVPEPTFRRERSKVLQAFASRKALYNTEPFRNSHEQRARANIARSLAQLRT